MRQLPLKKLIGIALLTAPLFGLLGATPALFFQRVDWSRVPIAFIFITGITLIFWFINILLLWGGQGIPVLKMNWVRYLVSIVLSLIILSLVFDIILPRPVPIEGPFRGRMAEGIPAIRDGFPLADRLKFRPRMPVFLPHVQAQSINIIVIVLLELVLMRDRKQQVEIENNQLRVANLEARNSQLKQQLHPHFLFNSLGTLRSLIRRSPDQAEEYLVKLSELLRFSTNNDAQTLVGLQEELELCTTYLNMQQVRFGEALYFHISVPASMQLLGKVPVYSIQQLAENAIKHNVLTQQQPLHIHINGDKEKYTITVTNNLQVKPDTGERNGVGLVNLAERYKLLGEEGIRINKTSAAFSVTIKVTEHESSDNRR